MRDCYRHFGCTLDACTHFLQQVMFIYSHSRPCWSWSRTLRTNVQQHTGGPPSKPKKATKKKAECEVSLLKRSRWLHVQHCAACVELSSFGWLLVCIWSSNHQQGFKHCLVAMVQEPCSSPDEPVAFFQPVRSSERFYYYYYVLLLLPCRTSL